MAYPDVILADSPFVYWRGEISGGFVPDATGGGRQLTVNGAVANAPSIVPSITGAVAALDFPGTDADYLSSVALLSTFSTFTGMFAEYWIVDNDEDDNSAGCVFAASGTFASGKAFTTGNVHRTRVFGNTSHPYGVSTRANRALHVVVGAFNTVAYVYINGRLLLSEPIPNFSTAAALSTLHTVGISIIPGPTLEAGTALKARVQELALYFHNVTLEDVQRHYYAGVDNGAQPTVTAASYRVDSTGGGVVRVYFNKPVFGLDLLGNYSIPTMVVTGASMEDDSRTVALLTVTGAIPNDSYTVTVSNVLDALGDPLASNTADFVARPPTVVAQPDVLTSSRLDVRLRGADSYNLALPPDANASVFNHRAYRTDTESYVYWTATGPDPIGDLSGVSPLLLEDVALVGIQPPEDDE